MKLDRERVADENQAERHAQEAQKFEQLALEQAEAPAPSKRGGPLPLGAAGVCPHFHPLSQPHSNRCNPYIQHTYSILTAS